MDFSFECGGCNAVYKLSEDQIAVNGVKITCPRCLSFFFLRKGPANATTPIIEKLASKDGAFQVTTPPPKRGELTTDILIADENSQSLLLDKNVLGNTDPAFMVPSTIEHEKTAESFTPNPETTVTLPPIDPPVIQARTVAPAASSINTVTKPVVTQPPPSPVIPSKTTSSPTGYSTTLPKEEKITPAMSPPIIPPVPSSVKTNPSKSVPAAKITERDLSDYPKDHDNPTRLEKWLVPAGLGLVVVLGIILGLNYAEIIKIPGLMALRKNAPKTEYSPNEASPPKSATPKPQYGFPKLEEVVPPAPEAGNSSGTSP